MSPSPLAASLIAHTPDLFSGEVRAALRRDAPELLMGTLLTAVGVLSLAVHGLRNKSNEKGLVWFGLFTAGFGIRLILFADLFGFAALPVDRLVWFYLGWGITYTLPLLGTFFLREIFPDWAPRIPRYILWLLGVFAVARNCERPDFSSPRVISPAE